MDRFKGKEVLLHEIPDPDFFNRNNPREQAKVARGRAIVQHVADVAVEEGAEIVQASGEEVNDFVSRALFRGLDLDTAKTILLSEFLANPRALPMPFVVKDPTKSRGVNKAKIDTPDKLFKFLKFCRKYGTELGDKLVCQKFVDTDDEVFTSVGVTVDAFGEEIVTSLKYGLPKDNDYPNVIMTPVGGVLDPNQPGLFGQLLDPNSEFFLGDTIFQSNISHVGGQGFIDTGVKGERLLRDNGSKLYAHMGAPEDSRLKDLQYVGGEIILNPANGPQVLTPLQERLVRARGVNPETLRYRGPEIKIAKEAALKRAIVNGEVHEVLSRYDFVGGKLIEVNTRPSSNDYALKFGILDRFEAELSRVGRAIRGRFI